MSLITDDSSIGNAIENVRKRYQFDSLTHSDEINKFNIFHNVQLSHELTNSIGYIFFTKPDLNIYKRLTAGSSLNTSLATEPILYDLINQKAELLKNLQIDTGGSNFIKPFYNAITAFDPADEVITTRESAETCANYKIMYGYRNSESKAANTISLQMRDDRELDIYNLLQFWVNYIDLVSAGKIAPSDYNKKNRILDYAGSIYYFLTSEDGESIIFYSEYTGVFPKNVPSSSFSYSIGDFKALQYNVEFQYSFKRDKNPLSILNFNKVSGLSGNVAYKNLIDPSDDRACSTLASNVYVHMASDGTYKLRFVN